MVPAKNRPRSIQITHERPKAAPRCAQEAPEGEKATKLVEIETHFGAEIAPKTAPRPFTRHCWSQSKLMPRFFIDFWADFRLSVDF